MRSPLTENWLLSDLMPDEAVELEKVAARESLVAGSVLVEQGRPNDSLWIVRTGKLGIYSGDKVVAELGEGDILGEMSWLDGQPASATVKGFSATSEVYRLRFNDFEKFLGTHADAHIQILRKFAINLSHRLRG